MTFRSWKSWGRERQQRSLLREHENYKREAMEDRTMSNVFIIINEWVNQQDNEGSEVTGGKYFTSEDQAWEALGEIAVAYNRDITHEDLSFTVSGDGHIKYEEYYIQELTNGDN